MAETRETDIAEPAPSDELAEWHHPHVDTLDVDELEIEDDELSLLLGMGC